MANLNVSIWSSLFGRSDEQAMWRVQTQEDHGAFAALMERWEAPIQRLCARMIGDSHRAEDLTQETFRRVYERRMEYRPTARFSTYLWRIALNLCYDEIRRVNRRRESSLEANPQENLRILDAQVDAVSCPDSSTVDHEEGELVRQALMQLPEIYRTVLILRHYEGLKLREIGEVLEIPEGTVNSRMAKALAQLTQILEPQIRAERAGELPPRQPTKGIYAL